MKKIFFIPLLLFGAIFFSCEKVTVQEPRVSAQDNAVVDPGAVFFGKSDAWYVASFKMERLDMTAEFSPFRFVFHPDRTLFISNDVFTVNGTWDLVVDEEIPVKLVIALDKNIESALPPAPFTFLNEINGDWEVVQYQKNMLWLANRLSYKEMVIGRGEVN